MAVFCKLADPQHYRAFDWNMADSPADLAYWLDMFENFSDNIERHLREDDLTGPDFDARWAAFRREYDAGIRAFRLDPRANGGVDTLSLVHFRRELSNKHGWLDPYLRVKERENDLAARLYPGVIAEIDAREPGDRWITLLTSVFAGNMFDLGSTETIKMYSSGQLDYHQMLAKVPPRPWYIDHADALVERLRRKAYRHVMYFVDNAGSDVVLGALPLVREIARHGITATIAANTEPALNDITIDELNPLLDRLGECDPVLAGLRRSGKLRTVGDGDNTPLIDFAQVSDECNREAADCDLVVLEGMGRGVESNWHQTFTCDVARIALVKDSCVAGWVGAKMFDAVCRFDPVK
jgi:damage-control phosphatase, subfamily II, stand-alone protein